MDLQNLAYAVIQVVHNFGAVAVVGSAVYGLWPGLGRMRKPLAWIMLAGWAAQAVSGGAFGGVSWLYYGRFPDIHGIGWSERAQQAAWRALATLAATALTAAAFLRWFS